MNSDPNTLIESSKCFRCIPDGEQLSVQIYLISQWSNNPTPPNGGVDPIAPNEIACLQSWFRMEELVGFNDGDPIAVWPAFFGATNLNVYDPGGTSNFPLYELAGPNPGGPNVNFANQSAFEYVLPPYPLEVFMVAFHNASVIGSVRGTILSSSPALGFDAYIDSPTNRMHMNLGVDSTLNVDMFPFYGAWTTLSIAMAGAASNVDVDGISGTLAPANPGANVPDPSLAFGAPEGWGPADVGVTLWGGSVAEICIFNCVLTDAERAGLRQYFQNKFSLI